MAVIGVEPAIAEVRRRLRPCAASATTPSIDGDPRAVLADVELDQQRQRLAGLLRSRRRARRDSSDPRRSRMKPLERALSATARSIAAGVTASEVRRIFSIPPSAITSASLSVAQQMPMAPARSARRAISTDFAPLLCGLEIHTRGLGQPLPSSRGCARTRRDRAAAPACSSLRRLPLTPMKRSFGPRPAPWELTIVRLRSRSGRRRARRSPSHSCQSLSRSTAEMPGRRPPPDASSLVRSRSRGSPLHGRVYR